MASRQIRDYLENGSIVHSVSHPDCPLGPVTRPRLLVLHQNIPNVLQSISWPGNPVRGKSEHR